MARFVETVGFTNDLAMATNTKTLVDLMEAMDNSLWRIEMWMVEKELEQAPEKMEVIRVRLSPKKRNKRIFRHRNSITNINRAIKYLGMWLNTQRIYNLYLFNEQYVFQCEKKRFFYRKGRKESITREKERSYLVKALKFQ